MRDDFTQKTKDILARRVGMCCSNPFCRKLTSGPHNNPNKSINVGVACHITAASPRGPRYNSEITNEQRKSIKNGIWLCQTCAKLIDSDPSQFTVDLLLQWKNISEDARKNNIEKGSYENPPFQTIKVLIVTAETPSSGNSFYKTLGQNDAKLISDVLLFNDTIDILLDANTAKLSETLMKHYDIIQFEVNVQHNGSLTLGNEICHPAVLANILKNRGVKCVLFTTCNSANIIGALHAMDIPYIIAASGNLYEKYCIEYCTAFYSSLSNGFNIPEAFDHANVLASQSMNPSKDLRSEGNLCIYIKHKSNKELSLRLPNK